MTRGMKRKFRRWRTRRRGQTASRWVSTALIAILGVVTLALVWRSLHA